MPRVIHLDAYTPDIFGYTDQSWTEYKVNFGPNRVLERLGQEEGWDCSVHYFTRDRNLKVREERELPYYFHPVTFPSLPPRLYPLLTRKYSVPFYRHYLQFSVPFLRHLKSYPPDLIVINITAGFMNYAVGGHVRSRQIPYIAHLHGGNYWGGPLRQQFMRNASAVIVTSKCERNQICRHYQVDPGRIHEIPVGVDTEKFRPRKDYQNSRAFPDLLFVGRVVRTKGVKEAVECLCALLPRFPKAHLTVIGPIADRQYFSEIQSFIKDHGMNSCVSFLGAKPSDELPLIYKRADLFVYPSFLEGNPAVVMEAMASGTPVVALRTTPGANEVIVNGENGVLSDVDSLSSDVTGLLKNGKLLEQFSEKARGRIVQFYSAENTFKKHRALYRSVMNSPNTAVSQEGTSCRSKKLRRPPPHRPT